MRHLSSRALATVALFAPAALAAQPSAAKPDLMKGAERGAFVIRMGSDTLAVERFARTKARLEVEGLSRSPRTLRRSYSVTYGADGMVTSLTLDAQRVDGSLPPTHVEATFGADSVTVNMTANNQPRTMTMATRGALPQIGVGASIAMLEGATLRLAATRADSLVVPVVFVGAAAPTQMTLHRVGRDSVTFTFPNQGPYRARVDRAGRILGLQGLETTQKVVAERVKDVDVAALAASFAQRDVVGGAVGTLSPADSTAATLGAASVRIAYSRPALRGRSAMGGVLVPYGQVWRTGANQATTLTSDADLTIGGTTVPRGKYTLWTLPTADGWQLIVNRKVLDERGAPLWGTMYDATQDVARIPLQVSASPETLERFRITLEGGAGGAHVLRMAWERTVLSVPVVATP